MSTCEISHHHETRFHTNGRLTDCAAYGKPRSGLTRSKKIQEVVAPSSQQAILAGYFLPNPCDLLGSSVALRHLDCPVACALIDGVLRYDLIAEGTWFRRTRLLVYGIAGVDA
jgi:hypothetical protein